MTQHFSDFNLPAALGQALVRMNYDTPTPIQAQAIPLAMQGRDILGSAQTGTGKTAAFGIPLVARLMQNRRGSALVLTPTRELAVQVIGVLKQLLATSPAIRTALLIGGEPMPPQLMQLRARPRLIVGTPGRINDHLSRGSLMLHDANFLVLDETDRMLDLGFGVQIEKIVKFLPQGRQTLLFSATLPADIVKLSGKYLNNPERIAVGSSNATAKNVTQEIIQVSETAKYTELLKQIDERSGSIIIFVKTKRGADRLAQKLTKQKHSADAIHGDLLQRQRDRVIAAFRDKRHRILVATDIAARGLDIPHIEHVINYDLPTCPEDYIHRIGRTARAGADGSSLCLVSPEDGKKWAAIHKMLHPEEYTGKRPQGAQNGSKKPQGANSGGGNSAPGGARRRRYRSRGKGPGAVTQPQA